MLKMYHDNVHSGNSSEFWEANWEGSQFELALKFCVIDPLRPLFEKYSGPGSIMLEGGCGTGNYVAYYASRGWHVVGLDYAQETLKKLRIRQPNLNLCGGDVSRLPFADETFDVYYSGGVVEHFESGAEASLREARRVLKKDGFLLISVPYQSPLRQILSPFKRGIWRKVEKSAVDENEGLAGGKRFFQYAYRQSEFKKMLSDAGLRVIETQGYAVLWGLYDIPFLNPSGSTAESANVSEARRENSAINIEPLIADQKPSLIKRLVVSEDGRVPVGGVFVKLMRVLSANMMMYVCAPE